MAQSTFVCEICGIEYGNLATHLKRKHNINDKEYYILDGIKRKKFIINK